MRRGFPVIGMLVLCIGILGSCSSLPTKATDSLPVAEKYHKDTKLKRIFETAARGQGGKSGFKLLRKGDLALQERLYPADIAEHTLDAQYYIWNSDKSGKLLAQRLIQAGDRGVSVRIILDDFSIGDEYFDQNEHLNFKDLDLFAVGPVVKDVSQSFAEYWNSPWAIPIGRLAAADPGQGDNKHLERRLAESRTE